MDALPIPSLSLSRSHSRAKSPALHPLDKRQYALGIGLLLLVVVLWTSANFVTQVRPCVRGRTSLRDLTITYLNTSSFSLYLVPFLVRRLWRRDRAGLDKVPPPSAALPPLTVRETIHLSSIFCFFWFVANWSGNAALGFTSVASATILSSMSGFFTLGVGRLFGVETLTLAKIGAVVTSFGGVLLVSLSDSHQSQPATALPTAFDAPPASTPHAGQRLLGDSLALLSAFFYALYVTLLKVRIRSEARIDMQLFFGFVGLFNVLACWPIGVLLHLTGVERFALPSSRRAVVALLINMAITLSSDYIYVLAMLKTTPLVVTIGLSLTMPLAVVGDVLLGNTVHLQVVVGALLLLASFVVVGVEDSKEPPPARALADVEARARGRRYSRVRGEEEEAEAEADDIARADRAGGT
ncbi:hypothetical protein HETIRDRAFT_469269 [Heterobasidion irregulare TC 32-1]|uniref:EamA domain-containing protein n=1 Tax=Heterobasidion irregulare (strain TC 32-1) TaxID=747525 RepID=W4KND5_HETIT|nr:uncharacterized protein HETIRDRAFT_469269 [Heterobasidion irregulare TC 32-1]ETW87333.1 hypothetical protein HETIRDRAFT_469269 [Heterobasidion irregulare TC 32-1]